MYKHDEKEYKTVTITMMRNSLSLKVSVPCFLQSNVCRSSIKLTCNLQCTLKQSSEFISTKGNWDRGSIRTESVTATRRDEFEFLKFTQKSRFLDPVEKFKVFHFSIPYFLLLSLLPVTVHSRTRVSIEWNHKSDISVRWEHYLIGLALFSICMRASKKPLHHVPRLNTSRDWSSSQLHLWWT